MHTILNVRLVCLAVKVVRQQKRNQHVLKIFFHVIHLFEKTRSMRVSWLLVG